MRGLVDKINRNIITAIIFLLAFFVFAPAVLNAELTDGGKKALDGLDETATKGYGQEAKSLNKDFAVEIGKVIGAILAFIGVLFFGLMIYGGFTWMLARGNEQEITKAKDLIISAIIGLIVVLSAYAITYYIGSVLTKSSQIAPPGSG